MEVPSEDVLPGLFWIGTRLNESFSWLRASDLYQLSLILPQLKVGPANQRHPFSPQRFF
jgi:hypothetical protein